MSGFTEVPEWLLRSLRRKSAINMPIEDLPWLMETLDLLPAIIEERDRQIELTGELQQRVEELEYELQRANGKDV